MSKGAPPVAYREITFKGGMKMKRLKMRTLVQASLLAGTMVLGGTAQAANYTVPSMSMAAFGALTATDTWTIGDLQLTGFSWGAGSTLASSGGSSLDTVSFGTAGGDLYVFRYNANVADATGSGSLTYTANALNGMLLSTGQTAWSGTSGTPTAGTLSLSNGSTVTATSDPGGSPSGFLPLSGTSVVLTTTWATNDSLVSSLQNNIQLEPAPAPLPILGAVAAFGWSRKLRRRIRESGQTAGDSNANLALAA